MLKQEGKSLLKAKVVHLKTVMLFFETIKWSNNIEKVLPFLLLMLPCQSVIMSNA